MAERLGAENTESSAELEFDGVTFSSLNFSDTGQNVGMYQHSFQSNCTNKVPERLTRAFARAA